MLTLIIICTSFSAGWLFGQIWREWHVIEPPEPPEGVFSKDLRPYHLNGYYPVGSFKDADLPAFLRKQAH